MHAFINFATAKRLLLKELFNALMVAREKYSLVLTMHQIPWTK